jgi:putative ABC transport system permease protein
VRITPEYSKIVFRYDDKMAETDRIYYADSTMFTMFDYKLLAGDRLSALKEINSIVLTKTTAEKFFGPMKEWRESPLGKIIVMNNRLPLTITAVMEDFPTNTHFRTNGLISFSTFLNRSDPTKNWGWNDFYTYAELAPGTNYKNFESRIQDIIRKYTAKEDWDKAYVLQPLTDIHLHSNVAFELDVNGSAETVYFLSMIAMIILVVAWVNYVNLATARAGHRAKEIGVRKVNGASRGAVMTQFLLESFFMNFVALVLALGIVSVLVPLASELLGKPLTFSFLSDRTFLLSIVGIYVAGSLASGLYPAIVLSSFRPAGILKATSTFAGAGNSGLRKALVVFQFMISVGLITGTMIIGNQMKYIQDKKLGFSSDNTVILSASSTQENDSLNRMRYYTFRNAVLENSEFNNVSISSVLPGKSHNDLDTHGGLRMVGEPDDVDLMFTSFRVDENYIPIFNIELIAGKNFTDKYTKGDEKIIVNRKGAELLGFSDPEKIVGQKVQYWAQQKEVVGVIENYHHKSLKNTFEPMVLRHAIGGMLYVTVKLDKNASVQNTIVKLKHQWETVYPNDPFVYFFLNDHVKAQYQADQQFSHVFQVFSGFSMFIACLGLFGLISYSVTVRIKEIGVRKVLGASVSSIMLLFTRSYFNLLVISFVIGIPLANYFLGKWIDNFAYKTDISWTAYVAPMIIVTMLSFIAVSVEIIKAAMANPAKSLRSE